MPFSYVLVKSTFPLGDLDDPLELDSDPNFGISEYRAAIEQLFGQVAWTGDNGTISIGGVTVEIDLTPVMTQISVNGEKVPEEVVSILGNAKDLDIAVLDERANFLGSESDF